MKQIRALRANGIVMLVSSVITAVCVGGVLEALSDCGASDIHLHSVDVYGVRRSNGRTEHLVNKTGKGETEWIAQYFLPLCSE